MPCGKIVETKTVALAWKLVSSDAPSALGATAKISGSVISQTLQSEAFQKNLLKAFKQEVKLNLLNVDGNANYSDFMSQQIKNEFKSYIDHVRKDARDITQKELLAALKDSPPAKKLMLEVEELKCHLENSPVGLWVDENQGVVIFVGVFAILGGGYAMYHNKTGDPIAKLVNGKAHEFMLNGSINLKGEIVKFTPSEQKLEFKLGANSTYKSIKMGIAMSGLIHENNSNTEVKATDITGTFQIPVSQWILSGSAGVNDAQKHVSVAANRQLKNSLGLSLSASHLSKTKLLGASAGKTTIQNNDAVITLNFQQNHYKYGVSIGAYCNDKFTCDITPKVWIQLTH